MPIKGRKSNNCKERVLRIAVLSDLHAFDHVEKGGAEPSYLNTRLPEDPVYRHPLASLSKLIKDESLTADLLLCPGDMCDKANTTGIRYVWQKLQDLKTELNAKNLYVTPGNHDVDSRFVSTDYDAKGFLQTLKPNFPFEDEVLSDRFWSRNFVAITEPDYRIVVLNSAAYHGNVKENSEPEYLHGRVSPRTIDALRLTLEQETATTRKHINILLCHHHPHDHGDIEEADKSIMLGGTKLLELLDTRKFGNWIVIHGHKHHPRIGYAASKGSPPVVFSAGSFSARLQAELAQNGKNQFYIIEIPVRDRGALFGTFRAWDWAFGHGFKPAQPDSGLPAQGGFGNRSDIDDIADQILDAYDDLGKPYCNWSEIVESVPTVRYLMPEVLTQLVDELKSKDMTIDYNEQGSPSQMRRGNG